MKCIEYRNCSLLNTVILFRIHQQDEQLILEKQLTLAQNLSLALDVFKYSKVAEQQQQVFEEKLILTQNTFTEFSLYKCILFAWLAFFQNVFYVSVVGTSKECILYQYWIHPIHPRNVPLKNAKKIPLSLHNSIHGPFLWLQWCKNKKLLEIILPGWT